MMLLISNYQIKMRENVNIVCASFIGSLHALGRQFHLHVQNSVSKSHLGTLCAALQANSLSVSSVDSGSILFLITYSQSPALCLTHK